MNNVLLYFALKHDGDFEKIYNDIKAKVPVDENEFIKLKRFTGSLGLSSAITNLYKSKAGITTILQF